MILLGIIACIIGAIAAFSFLTFKAGMLVGAGLLLVGAVAREDRIRQA